MDEGYQPFPDVSAWTVVPFDPTTYDQYAALLEQARAEATEEAREHAVRTAIRYAGTDTGAIEGLYTTDRGFTRTVAIEAAHWEAAANERGPNAAAIIKDQIAAYEWVLDLVTQQRPVTEHMIRELHAMLCRSQETYVVHTGVGRQERPLPKGEYKQFPNNPTSATTGRLHHYAPPDLVAPEMGRLVASLSSDEYASAHPVVQAAYLHYALAAIHPFADGNGRVARALASVPLYRAVRVPLVVFRDERDEYLDALERADAGDVGIFVRFVADRVTDTVGLVSQTTRLGPAAAHEGSLEALRAAATAHGAITSDDLTAAATRVLAVAEEQVTEQLAALRLPPGISFKADRVDYVTTWEFVEHIKYRNYSTVEAEIDLQVQSGPFASVGSSAAVTAMRARVPDVPAVILATTLDIPPLELDLREVVPVIREVARIKVATWVERVLDTALAVAAARAAGGTSAPDS